MRIAIDLVQRLIASQFSQWKNLTIQPVAVSGWDNRTFHLGEEMLVRLPSAESYASQVEKEQLWLPQLAPRLPLEVPKPLAKGVPGEGYPFPWSIYQWIEGEPLSQAPLDPTARDLANFLKALHRIDTMGGPLPGEHNFYRGGGLFQYDHQTREAISLLQGTMDAAKATVLWEAALSSEWTRPPVWVHGDISVGNLLQRDGKLCAVIDFGMVCIGDPACDLSIAWTLFEGKSREIFIQELNLDEGTWERSKGWALWKALITASGLVQTNNQEGRDCWKIISNLL